MASRLHQSGSEEEAVWGSGRWQSSRQLPTPAGGSLIRLGMLGLNRPRKRRSPAPLVSPRGCGRGPLEQETQAQAEGDRPRRGGAVGPASSPLSGPHLGFLLAVAKETKPHKTKQKPSPHMCNINIFIQRGGMRGL